MSNNDYDMYNPFQEINELEWISKGKKYQAIKLEATNMKLWFKH